MWDSITHGARTYLGYPELAASLLRQATSTQRSAWNFTRNGDTHDQRHAGDPSNANASIDVDSGANHAGGERGPSLEEKRWLEHRGATGAQNDEPWSSLELVDRERLLATDAQGKRRDPAARQRYLSPVSDAAFGEYRQPRSVALRRRRSPLASAWLLEIPEKSTTA